MTELKYENTPTPDRPRKSISEELESIRYEPLEELFKRSTPRPEVPLMQIIKKTREAKK